MGFLPLKGKTKQNKTKTQQFFQFMCLESILVNKNLRTHFYRKRFGDQLKLWAITSQKSQPADVRSLSNWQWNSDLHKIIEELFYTISFTYS